MWGPQPFKVKQNITAPNWTMKWTITIYYEVTGKNQETKNEFFMDINGQF
jgi:hypothetical protein